MTVFTSLSACILLVSSVVPGDKNVDDGAVVVALDKNVDDGAVVVALDRNVDD